MQKFQQNVQNRQGDVIAGASVAVTVTSTNTPAALFSDNGVTSLTQPLTTDANGFFFFFAANGTYDVTVTGTTFAPIKWTSQILFDPDDLPVVVVPRIVGPGESITLNVPSSYATIQLAIDAVAAWVIASTGLVTIQVADGTYEQSTTINLNHPFGRRIRLVGNESTPLNCIIQAIGPGFDGIVVSDGSTLGYISGFTIKKLAKAPFSDNTTGLLALRGACIICGPKMVVDNWYYGIAARDGAFIYAPFASVDHAGDVGIWAFVGSTIDCPNAVSDNAADVGNGWGYGFQAEYGSALNCSNGSATGCNIGGIASLSNSNVRALGATASNNVGSGFFARDGGTIEAHNAIANNNTRYGIEEIGSSRVIGNAMTTTGNTIAGTKPKAYFDNNTLGARIVGEGDFRIDLAGTGAWYFNSPGGLQLSGSDTTGAVNRWNFTGSVSGQPLRWAPVGIDANIAAQLEAKGNEVVRLMSNGRPAFQGYNGSASVVNYGQCTGSITGQAVAFSAQGADANITFAVFGKGAGGTLLESNTGRLAFYGGTPVAKPAITGSRGGNAALASVLTQLATLGLLTDSTTA